ncbi:hypothetical protein [Pedobacter cryophilus]|uniref:Uncharacterized protein n=1 Tax=Pedobacter cryophilus TaxID=2571271 RepID=A0A4U1C3L3_9SPHI|nr:hypothetical protein [Pedobacter cryophilus]TKB98699.1 hypothetical protein FA046_06170 [Pedobacter cryophilus]
MEDLKSNAFSLKVNINNDTKEMIVQPTETTDGVTFYFCEIEGKKISELRKDENWQQVWGSLTSYEIKEIGSQIDQHERF